ncbi:MAG: hypothetical protein RL139_801 [Gemmatimonadota bacterium]|jgi:protein phosphatase
MTLHIAGRTDVGRTREHNEDAFIVADLSTMDGGRPEGTLPTALGAHGALLMVADGMGGAAAGEVASAMATAVVCEELERRWHRQEATDAETFTEALRAATEAANTRIHAHAATNLGLKGMGTTATIAGVLRDSVYIAQVGDSRGYLVRDGVATQLTKDQSLMQRLVDAGELTPEEAEQSERRNIILQALGPEARVKVEVTAQQLQRGDVLVLCSDGLSGQVRATEIAEVVARQPDLAVACRELIDRANAAGGPDNITVILARIDGAEVRPTTSEVPAHRPYQRPSAARPTMPLDRSSQAAIAAITDDEDTDEHPTPVRPAAAPPSGARPTVPPRRASEILEAEDAALLSPRTALLLLAVGALLLARWILR